MAITFREIILAPWQHQLLQFQRNWVHQPEKAAVALQEENTPKKVACPHSCKEICQQPAHLAEDRACWLCIYAGFCASCKLRNKTPRSHKAAPNNSVPWCEWNSLSFGKILSAYVLSQQLHIQVSQMFHCLIFFLFSPAVKKCHADAGMVLVTCTHWWGWQRRSFSHWTWIMAAFPWKKGWRGVKKECSSEIEIEVETSFWIGTKDIYFCFLFPFSLSWMPGV